ncbi:probable basic-leucine zipper transcription factor R [Trichoplusia ni]|uniref:Probable basic-leucine zipper transcription factor R n=1 Tax=Trichoplusia ni TaxID=7111 RepID=A0A7E5VX30_TRINI|nr:probable basic-leucine zipper transcription factor R [Trichoplusia ni]
MAAKFYMLCIVLSVGLAAGARPRPRLQQPIADEYDYEPQAQERAAGDQVVLVAADSYDGLYRASDRLDDEYEPRALQRQPSRLKQQQPIQEGPKQPPVQTIRNYNKVNDDGSFTFGYEAADGSFKEETRGTDCVVRGKYGYVDPDGNKREFTYVSGNPCDPNKPDDEEQDNAAPDSAERDDHEPNYPTRPAPRPTTPRPPTTFFQNDFRDADEDEVEEEPLQHIRQRVVQRPQPARRPAYQPQPIAITPRPLQVTSPRTLPPATTFRPQLIQVTAKPQPQIQYSPQPQYSPTPAPAVITTASPARPGQIDFAAEFAKFHRENQQQSTTAAIANPTKATSPAQPSPSGNPLYSTELVYDPSSGSYNTQLFQTLPQTKGELNLNQRLQPYVATPQHQQQQQQPRPFVPSPQLPSVPASPGPSGPLYRHQLQNPQQIYQRQQAENQFQNSQQLFAQQQQLQQSQLQRDRAAARAQAQRLQVAPQGQDPNAQFYFVAPRGESPSSGQIDAFLRGHGIQF